MYLTVYKTTKIYHNNQNDCFIANIINLACYLSCKLESLLANYVAFDTGTFELI